LVDVVVRGGGGVFFLGWVEFAVVFDLEVVWVFLFVFVLALVFVFVLVEPVTCTCPAAEVPGREVDGV
jgi:hypothetical protein